jgi:hypothetical protein
MLKCQELQQHSRTQRPVQDGFELRVSVNVKTPTMQDRSEMLAFLQDSKNIDHAV